MERPPMRMLIQDKLQNCQKTFKVTCTNSFPIVCPVSKNKLVNPGISKQCRHSERIELAEYFKYAFDIGEWKCPFCKVNTKYKDILVDKILKFGIEEASDRVDSITITPALTIDYKFKIDEMDLICNLLKLTRSTSTTARAYQVTSTSGFIITSKSYSNTHFTGNLQGMLSKRTFGLKSNLGLGKGLTSTESSSTIIRII